MAGIRHHILPKFLLKGFASRTEGKAVFTWVHRKGGKVFEASVVDVAVERHFYGKDEEFNLDESITEIESGFGALLDQLRREANGFELPPTTIADLVTHLSIRTKHLRESFVETSENLLGLLTGYLSNPDNFGAWLFDYYRRHPEVIKESVDKALTKMELTRPQRRILRRKLLNLHPEALFAETDISQQALMFSGALAMVLDKLPEIVKGSHIKAMAKSLVPEPRAEQYRNLRWVVYKSEVPLILGDVGCLFELERNRFVSTSGKEDHLIRVFLPIAVDTLIVGTLASELGDVDIERVNTISASISLDFFVSSESSQRTQALSSVIGERAEILSRDEILTLVKEVILEG